MTSKLYDPIKIMICLNFSFHVLMKLMRTITAHNAHCVQWLIVHMHAFICLCVSRCPGITHAC